MDRIVAHVDLDCFYVQVERGINSNLRNRPVAVNQYNTFGDLKTYAPQDNRINVSNAGLVAVSYEARARGVKRNMSGQESRVVCPELLIVQVPTAHGKADLTIYREASSKIVKVLAKRYKDITLEKSSIDEVYLDLTCEVNSMFVTMSQTMLLDALKNLYLTTKIAGEDLEEMRLTKREISKGHQGTSGNQMSDEFNWYSRDVNDWCPDDKRLICGALIIQQLRKDVFDDLGYTCSGGIAHNKMLAKIASAMHKPNCQTIVPNCITSTIMASLPISRVPGFGGKLGSAIEAHGDIQLFGDVLKLGREVMCQRFGAEICDTIWTAALGIDNDIVVDRVLPSSIGCSKSFRARNTLPWQALHDGRVLHWLTELAAELFDRYEADMAENNRRPSLMTCGASLLRRPLEEGSPTARHVHSTPLTKSTAFEACCRSPELIGKKAHELLLKAALLHALSQPQPLPEPTVGSSAVTSLAADTGSHGRHGSHGAAVALPVDIVSLSLSCSNFVPVTSASQSIHSYFKSNDPTGPVTGDPALAADDMLRSVVLIKKTPQVQPQPLSPLPSVKHNEPKISSNSNILAAFQKTAYSSSTPSSSTVSLNATEEKWQCLTDINESTLSMLPLDIQQELLAAMKLRSSRQLHDSSHNNLTLHKFFASNTSNKRSLQETLPEIVMIDDDDHNDN